MPDPADLSDSDSPQPWTSEEHSLFLEALERYAGNNGGTGANEWVIMAAHIATRTAAEVKAHAQDYFLKLQHTSSKKGSSSSRGPRSYGSRSAYSDEPFGSPRIVPCKEEPDGQKWSYEEDVQFETALGQLLQARPDLSADERWKMIAALIPHKAAVDISQRYEKLVQDIRLIEKGKMVCLTYCHTLSGNGGSGDSGLNSTSGAADEAATSSGTRWWSAWTTGTAEADMASLIESNSSSSRNSESNAGKNAMARKQMAATVASSPNFDAMLRAAASVPAVPEQEPADAPIFSDGDIGNTIVSFAEPRGPSGAKRKLAHGGIMGPAHSTSAVPPGAYHHSSHIAGKRRALAGQTH